MYITLTTSHIYFVNWRPSWSKRFCTPACAQLHCSKNCSESILHSRNRFVCKVQLVTISPLVSNGYTSGLPAVAVLAVYSKSCSESFLARIRLYTRLFGQLITITPPPPPPCSCRAGSVLSLCANITCLLSVMMQPYMPQVSQQIQEQTQVGEKCLWYIHNI